jgi:hypothetical protein
MVKSIEYMFIADEPFTEIAVNYTYGVGCYEQGDKN